MENTHVLVRAGRLCILATAVVAIAAVSAAQEIPDTGGKVFGQVGGSFGDGGASITTSGGAGIRLTRQLGIDFEVLHVTGMDLSEDDDFFIQRLTFAPPFEIERDGSLTAFLAKLNVEFPVGGRLIPFLAGGGGVGRLSETFSFDVGRDIDTRRLLDLLPVTLRPLIFPPEDFTVSETGLALTLEGGLTVRLWKGLGIGADARWMRLLTDRGELDFAQIASRVSYRF